MKFTRKVSLAAFKASIPVLLGYLAMGMAAGILLVSRTGLNPAWGLFTSATSISGALQFLLVDMFCNQTPLWTVAIMTFCLNVRYALYGLPFIERWRTLKWPLKLYMILTLTDETFALEVENNHPEGEDSLTYCFLVSLFNHSYWIAGVVTGSMAGALISINSQGIDFAMTALFIVILLDQLREKANRMPSCLGFASAFLGLCIYPGNMLIPAIAIVLAALLAFQRKLDKPAEDNEPQPPSPNAT